MEYPIGNMQQKVKVMLFATSLIFTYAQAVEATDYKDANVLTNPAHSYESVTDAASKKSSAKGDTSFLPIAIEESFVHMMGRLKADKPAVMERQMAVLNERYDLSDHHGSAIMSGGKPLQEGVRVKQPAGVTWGQLSMMTPDEIRRKDVFPQGFMPLPHPKQKEGGFVFPKMQIDMTKKLEHRDLARFDVDFDIPERFLPEFPAPMYLVNRPDLGDVAKGQLVTSQNYYELFNGLLTPQQLDGLRLLVTPFPQQQFNLTSDRRVAHPSFGTTCFDCHTNGNTNGATHLAPSSRPQENRRRLDVPTLRGVNIQRLFGSQRSLRSVEDFTEFEQRTAYFDGDTVIATKKGVNFLDRAGQVANMVAFQSIMDFPPAPKLNGITGKLDPAKASPSELAGQKLFFGKATCGSCHQAPYYTDNSVHDLGEERFFTPRMINGRMATGEGAVKTFPLRGIKDTPPYLHDGRLLTLADTVEYFNLVLGTQLNEQEKKDLAAFMQAL